VGVGKFADAVTEGIAHAKAQRRIYETDTEVKRKNFVDRAHIYQAAAGGEFYSACRWTLWNCESSTRTSCRRFLFLPLAATHSSGLLFNFKSINGCDQTSIQALGL
jgi:hypothetical protein